MPRNLMLTCALLAAISPISACGISSMPWPSGSDMEPAGPRVAASPPHESKLTGDWSGSAEVPGLGMSRTLKFSVEQSGTEVTGGWEITALDGVVLFSGTLTGVDTRTGYGLTLMFAGAAPITVRGEMHGRTAFITTVDGAGWTDTPMTLERQ